MTGIPKKQEQPFAEREKRALSIRADRIDSKYLTSLDGLPPRVAAEHKRDEKYPTHEARHYEIKVVGHRSEVRVQLNGSTPAADEARLTAIVEDLLSPETRCTSGLIAEG